MQNILKLSELEMFKSGKILNINCKGEIKRRLLDIGLIKDTKIIPVLKSPSGDPRAFSIRGSLIAIRKEDARNIEIEEVKEIKEIRE